MFKDNLIPVITYFVGAINSTEFKATAKGNIFLSYLLNLSVMLNDYEPESALDTVRLLLACVQVHLHASTSSTDRKGFGR